jgi:predicted TIM-barrel fold metal-dependent hydrolase
MASQLNKRQFLQSAAMGLGAIALDGCEIEPPLPTVPVDGYIVDTHCHLFNGTDIPIIRFLRDIVLKDHDPKGCDIERPKIESFAPIEDEDIIDRLFKLIVEGLLRNAPTAQQEYTLLRQTEGVVRQDDQARVKSLVVNRVAEFLSQVPAESGRPKLTQSVDERLRDKLFEAAGRTRESFTFDKADAVQTAQLAYDSQVDIGATIRWVGLFLRYRHSLAQELATTTSRNGRQPLLLVPLMVDYSHWLGQGTTAGSGFPDQVRVFGEIARVFGESDGPAVHGMVAFDPLRAVFRRRHVRYPAFGTEFEPVELARDALLNHGFLGLKVYPPMGFKPIGNTDEQGYQERLKRPLKTLEGVGQQLDEAMASAFKLCLEFDAPIIAHANNSISAGKGYARRGEPRNWIPVLRRWPTLRLCLAHQGRFCWRETNVPPGTPPGQQSWEWTIGRYLHAHPNSNLYMDISYLSEVLKDERERASLGAQLGDWINKNDADARHIVYGTDWIMLGREANSARYGATIRDFLGRDCSLSKQQVERILVINPLRYLGLLSGRTRERILRFYRDRGLPNPKWAQVRDA